MKISLYEYTDAVVKYYTDPRNFQHLRLGQFLCNHFSLHDNDLFYEETVTIALRKFTKYLDVES